MPDDPTVISALRQLDRGLQVEHAHKFKPQLAHSTVQVGVAAAAARGLTGTGSSIAIIDTGVNYAHSMISKHRVVAESCFSVLEPLVRGIACPNGEGEYSGAGLPCYLHVELCPHGTAVAAAALVLLQDRVDSDAFIYVWATVLTVALLVLASYVIARQRVA